MKQAVVGLLAHVDAGKTTLAEAMLYAAGAIRRRGRVDHGDAHLDCDALERERGITIFSKQAVLEYAGCHLMLLDAPGHVDFSAEAERTLAALDYAILVVGANDGVQGHTETLWDLLARYGVPVFVFVNKADLTDDGGAGALGGLRRGLDPACIDGTALLAGEPSALEDAASADEAAFVATARAALKVPDDPSITYMIGEPTYWEGADAYTTYIEFQQDGETVAYANCWDDGTPARNIYAYTAPR